MLRGLDSTAHASCRETSGMAEQLVGLSSNRMGPIDFTEVYAGMRPRDEAATRGSLSLAAVYR
jgi:hypothetical protein